MRTVFDLAASQVFATAAALIAAGADATTVEARLNEAAPRRDSTTGLRSANGRAKA